MTAQGGKKKDSNENFIPNRARDAPTEPRDPLPQPARRRPGDNVFKREREKKRGGRGWYHKIFLFNGRNK